MKLTNQKEMQDIDSKSINEYNIPGLLLMEHAALAVYHYIKDNVDIDDKIVIVIGPGNNGGDGLALARLFNAFSSYKVEVIMLSSLGSLSEDGVTYYNILKELNVDINENLSIKEIFDILNKCDVIIDAIFGTGISRNIEGKYFEVIELINYLHKNVISVDIPSGINCESGNLYNIAIKANTTLTFAFPKLGLYLYPGIEYAGEVIVAKIGIPEKVIDECPSNIALLDRKTANSFLPDRYLRSNKGTYGRVLLIGGSLGMSGAIILAAKAVVGCGAGICRTALPKTIQKVFASSIAEAMSIGLDDIDGCISYSNINRILEEANKSDVVAIGPGIGRNDDIEMILKELLKSELSLVIDADALYALSNIMDMIKDRDAITILTPHPGEFSKLCGLEINEILANPLKAVQDFVAVYNVTLVLKLERTIIANSKDTYINTTGNNGLSCGGSGDVLTGIIASLLAQNDNSIEAASLGVYLHGLSADLLLKDYSVYTMTPSNVIEGLNNAFIEVEKNL
ncbi:MAG: NAD(P)H-hydrate dehydratase [Erysipelotrichaceae bacterium]